MSSLTPAHEACKGHFIESVRGAPVVKMGNATLFGTLFRSRTKRPKFHEHSDMKEVLRNSPRICGTNLKLHKFVQLAMNSEKI